MTQLIRQIYPFTHDLLESFIDSSFNSNDSFCLTDKKEFMTRNSFYYDFICEESDNEFLFQMDVPGVKKDQISIVYENDTLVVSSTDSLNDSDLSRSRRTFSKKVTIRDIDFSKAKAHLDLGVLSITLPKVASAKPQRLSVK